MAELQGLSAVLQKLNKTIEDIELHTKEGLTEAALVVKADSVRGTPIDLGNLRNSAFILVTDSTSDNESPNFEGKEASQMGSDHSKGLSEAKGIVQAGKHQFNAIIGYTANYAFWVHEMPASFNFNQGSNKFLEKALMKNKDRILKILVKWAQLK
jgi:hypothetical protein